MNMKVTPLEIKQKQFERKTLGGIDKDEVQAFLNSLSIAWEKILEDQANLKSRLDYSEKEVAKLREVEVSLYKTLKAAEETSEKTLTQAQQQAQLIVSEAKLKAETLLQDAKWKASKAMEQAEEYSKKSFEQMVMDVKVLEKELHSIENLKDSFLSDIRIIAQDLLEKAERATQKSANFKFKVPEAPNLGFERPVLDTQLELPVEIQAVPDFNAVEDTMRIHEPPLEKHEDEIPPFQARPIEKSMPENVEKEKPKVQGSFFDSI
jgi:cell division initiation protein